MGFSLAEIPIIFADRARGKSKMNGAIFAKALRTVWKLRRGANQLPKVLKSIFTNDWISGDFRIFFVSYWLKYGIYRLFGLTYIPYVLLNIGFHLGSAVLLFNILALFDR